MIKMVAIRSFYKFYGITEKIINRKKYQTKKYPDTKNTTKTTW